MIGQLVVRRVARHYFDGPGVVTFTASTAHSAALSYTINVYTYSTTTLQASRMIGKPTPDISNEIRHDCRTLFTPLAAGNYTLTVQADFSSGSNESSSGADFSLPLP